MLSLISERRTLWHDIPAGRKLLALMAATLAALWLATPLQAAGFALGVAALYLAGGARFAGQGLRALRPVLPFVVILLVWHLWTRDLAAGVVIVLRMVALVALANLVTLTTPLSEMLERVEAALQLLRLPEAFRRRLALAVALVIRFVPVLLANGRALAEAWRARSPRRPGWRLVFPFTLSAIDEAERVAEALRARSGGL